MMRALLVSALIAGPGLASAQTNSEADQIRDEMRQLKEDFQRRMDLLEQRLNRLEGPGVTNPAAAQPATNRPPEKSEVTLQRTNAIAAAKQFANEQFQYDTESREYATLRESHPLRERMEQVLSDFVDIKAYIRAGYGRDDKGGPQVAFQAPGALSKYRLGNEAETYGELTFGKNFYVPNLFSLEPQERPDGTPTGPIARVQLTASMYNPYQNLLSSQDTTFGLPEAFASIGNVFEAQPSLKFWAGNRFYRRHDIHINDFFFYNMSGAGGGVEDFQLPFGKAALAWIGGGTTSGFSDLPQPDANNKAGFSKGNWDLRLYDVPLPVGKGEFGVVYARADSGNDSLGRSAPSADGFAFTFLDTAERFISDDGVNKFSVQYGTGAAKTFTSGFETFTQTNGVFIIPEVRDSWRFRVTEHFIADLNEHFSIGPAFVYQITEYREQGGQVQWASGGVRPIFYFNKYLNVAFEGGVDWVKDNSADTSSYLCKLTLAPQVSLGNRFMSRPVVRAFVTYAFWGNEFRGLVGGNDYADATQGLTYGVQMEAWW
jgi:maltoporin